MNYYRNSPKHVILNSPKHKYASITRSPLVKRRIVEQSARNLYSKFYGHSHEFNNEQDASDDEDDTMQLDDEQWADESTLLQALQSPAYAEQSTDLITPLAESLLLAPDVSLSHSIASIMVPTVRVIRNAHDVATGEYDVGWMEGLRQLDEGSKRIEEEAVRLTLGDDAKEILRASTRIKELYAQLAEECAKRDKLYEDFKEEQVAVLEDSIAKLQLLPNEIETIIAKTEEKYKAYEKESSSAVQQKMIKNLLSSFS